MVNGIIRQLIIRRGDDILGYSPKVFRGLPSSLVVLLLANFDKINQIRIVPKNDVFHIEISTYFNKEY